MLVEVSLSHLAAGGFMSNLEVAEQAEGWVRFRMK